MTAFDRISVGSAGWVEVPTGNSRTVDVYVVRGNRPGPRAVVTAGIHGDEYEGPAAVRSLIRTVLPDMVIGEVALAPVANPTAFTAGTRTNPEDGKNLAHLPGGTHTGRRPTGWLPLCGLN